MLGGVMGLHLLWYLAVAREKRLLPSHCTLEQLAPGVPPAAPGAREHCLPWGRSRKPPLMRAKLVSLQQLDTAAPAY